MERRRGNRSWGQPFRMDSIAPITSGFDEVVRNLGLLPHQYQTSLELKEWVRKNRNEKYVPLELLGAWRFIVEEKNFTKGRQPVYKR